LSETPAVHECVAAALVRGGRVLLCHRRADRAWFPDVWDLPGGHVDPGEPPLDALRRELREELGIEAVVDGARFASYAKPDLSLDVWLVRDWTGDVVNGAPDEHDELRWITAAEISGLAYADDAYLDLLAGVLTD
jgi:mutator protein MutT